MSQTNDLSPEDTVEEKVLLSEPAPVPAAHHALLEALRSPQGARTAIIMAEVLGRPKGLE